MTKPVELKTECLLLRQWTEADFPLFEETCADPQVMEFFSRIKLQVLTGVS